MMQMNERPNRRARNTGAGMGVGTAAVIVGTTIASSQGIEIDSNTAAAAGSLATAFFGWIGSMFR